MVIFYGKTWFFNKNKKKRRKTMSVSGIFKHCTNTAFAGLAYPMSIVVARQQQKVSRCTLALSNRIKNRVFPKM